MLRLLLLSLLLMVMAACGTADSQQNPPSVSDPFPSPTSIDIPDELLGEFYCSGHEFGLLAFAGRLVLSEYGIAVLLWMDMEPAVEGTWRYDPSTEQVTFSDEMEISHAQFHRQMGSLDVYLREGVERAHVELGVMNCQLQE